MLAGQALIRDGIDRRVQAEVERALQAQAQLIADDVSAAPAARKLDRAANAARYLVRTQIVVRWPTKPGLFVNVVPLQRVDVQVTARSGDVEVRMSRQAESEQLPRGALAAVAVLVTLAALGVWILAGSLTRRLVRQTRQLAGVAEAIAEGDHSVRVAETDDELGRVARAFNRMAGRLEDSDLRQRRLLADIAHELRTPVTAIHGFAEALTDGAATSDDDRREAAEFITQEATRLSGLVSDLRNLTLLDLGGEVNPEVVDLARAGERANARCALLADERNITLHFDGSELPVTTDAGHLDTILANLVTNAINATPSGGRVTVHTGVAPDGRPWIAVRDTGTGIAPQHLDRIFDRLYRVSSTRARGDGGSGLGLPIVRRLVDLLGAEIEVQSTLGSGSTFTVSFPADTHRQPTTTDTANG